MKRIVAVEKDKGDKASSSKIMSYGKKVLGNFEFYHFSCVGGRRS